jgi:hypothetical protein
MGDEFKKALEEVLDGIEKKKKVSGESSKSKKEPKSRPKKVGQAKRKVR